MIIDRIENAARYNAVHTRIKQALDYLQATDLNALSVGRHTIDGDNLFAIVQEYETLDTTNEQMESHRKYTDVQYMIQGAEQVGHAILNRQTVSKEYDAENDFMLYADAPLFFTRLEAGTFMVFFPTDLHMPCIHTGKKEMVKKVVVKCLNDL